MIGPIETLRDTANSWECDENDHINIKSYARRFDDAVRAFLVEARWQVPHRTSRLIRFHAELRGGEPVNGTTAIVAIDGGQVALEHRLYASHRMANGEPLLSATALDLLPDVEREDLSAFDLTSASADALPKTGRLDANQTLHISGLDRLPVTYKGVVPNDAFGPEAESTNGPRLSDHYLVGIISDAATHIWAEAGATDDWLRERGWGRAAVQLRLRYGTRPQAGDVVDIRSAIVAFTRKTVSYRHLIVNQMTETVIAEATITSLMLDLSARRAIPWPDDNLKHLHQKVAEFDESYSS